MSWVWILIILFVIMIVVVVALYAFGVQTMYILLVGGFFFLIILIMVAIIAMEPAPKRVIVPPPMPIQTSPTVVVHEHMAPPVPIPVPQPVYYDPPVQPPMNAPYNIIHVHTQGPQGEVYDDVRTEYEMVPRQVSYGRQDDVIPNGTSLISERQIGNASVDRRPVQQTRVTPPTQYESVVSDERGNRYQATVKQPGKVTSVITNPPEQQTRVLRQGESIPPGARYYRDERTGQYHLIR